MSANLVSKRKELDKLNSIIDSYNQEIDKKTNELSEYQIQKNELITQIISDEHLLKNSNWELVVENSLTLFYSGKIDDVIMSHITILTNQYSFFWIDLEPGIQLQINEDEAKITFDEPKQIISFVKKHKMKVSGSLILDKIRALKREVSALEQMSHIFLLKD